LRLCGSAQLFEQTPQGPHFQRQEVLAQRALIDRQPCGRAKVAQARLTVHGVDQDVVGVQVAVHHAALVQLRQRTGHIAGYLQGQSSRKPKVRRVHVAGAAVQAGRCRQIDMCCRNQRHEQTLGLRRVASEPRHGRGERRVLPCTKTSGQLVFGQAVAGHLAFEQLERQGLLPSRGLDLVDVTRSALAQQGAKRQIGPSHTRQFGRSRTNPAHGIAGQRQPGQARQLGQPAGHLGQAVGRNAHQLQFLRRLQAIGQRGELVAR
jgi:hypothetical protein